MKILSLERERKQFVNRRHRLSEEREGCTWCKHLIIAHSATVTTIELHSARKFHPYIFMQKIIMSLAERCPLHLSNQSWLCGCQGEAGCISITLAKYEISSTCMKILAQVHITRSSVCTKSRKVTTSKAVRIVVLSMTS